MNTEQLMALFREHWANSANYDRYPDLTCRSAGLLASQLCALARRGPGHQMRVRQHTSFESEHHDRLGQIFNRHGSDKAGRHHYHRFYCYMLEQLGLDRPLHLFEIGLGTNNPELVSTMGVRGKPGASLRAWQEFLPNASVYGADIDRDMLFQDQRIETAWLDQLDAATFEQLPFADRQFDVVIDDGLHSIGANLNTLLFGLDRIRPGGWIVIEDIKRDLAPLWSVVDQLLATNPAYQTCFIECVKPCLYVVHRQQSVF